jgi:hypothetical protein
MMNKIKISTVVIVLAVILIKSAELYSQGICGQLNNSSTPPSPYSDGSMRFDGKGDFLRTQDVDVLEFEKSTTESFTIETVLKITNPWKPQYILGKKYNSGWLIGYHTLSSGYVTVYFSGAGWKNIYYLGADTSWHSYKIEYNKQELVLRTYVDGNLTNTYSDFSYDDLQDASAFSVGNVGFFAQYGPQSVNLSSRWFKGCVDNLRIFVNESPVMSYNFNECAGQVARDSASFFIVDRTYPGDDYCSSVHFMLGTTPAKDTCDPSWIINEYYGETKFAYLGSGLESIYYEGNSVTYGEHFSLGLTVWNGYLINGGKFNTAGGVPANHIAKWDGSSWSALGGGLNHEVVFVELYNNELYATGNFDTAYGSGQAKYIAKWNGNSWSALAGGLNESGFVMGVYNNELYVGGCFDSVDGIHTGGIAKWNGSQWNKVGGGINGIVWALCEFNGELYAAGIFTFAEGKVCNGIARWNGVEWNPAGEGIAWGTIFVLAVYNNELYAGGSFSRLGGVTCNNIGKYNGTSWSAVGSGAAGSSCVSISGGHVIDMEVYNNELYVVGQFTQMDGIPANKIAKFNGSNWCGIEYGIDLRPEDLEIYNGDLIINGDFYSISGVEYNNIASYNPENQLIINNNNNNIPSEYMLGQNYPNPFNPSTTIKYRIPGEGLVKLTVFDVTGREVALAVNETKQAGDYSVSFDGFNFSTGVYFYRLDVNSALGGNFSQTKKMVLIK